MLFADAAKLEARNSAPEEDVSRALMVLGPEATTEIDALPALRRAELADRFVRNLRTLAVAQAPVLHRRLLHRLDATPNGEWRSELRDPMQLMALRNQLKYVLTAVGLEWEAMTRLQACICGLGRWIEAAGGGKAQLQVGGNEVRFSIELVSTEDDPSLVEHSPIALALREVVRDLSVERDEKSVRFNFAVRAA